MGLISKRKRRNCVDGFS